MLTGSSKRILGFGLSCCGMMQRDASQAARRKVKGNCIIDLFDRRSEHSKLKSSFFHHNHATIDYKLWMIWLPIIGWHTVETILVTFEHCQLWIPLKLAFKHWNQDASNSNVSISTAFHSPKLVFCSNTTLKFRQEEGWNMLKLFETLRNMQNLSIVRVPKMQTFCTSLRTVGSACQLWATHHKPIRKGRAASSGKRLWLNG